MLSYFFDSAKARVYVALQEFCEVNGRDAVFQEELWNGLYDDDELLNELIYFLEYQNIKDTVVAEGYRLTDLYVFAMTNSNLFHDTGKNGFDCNKNALVLDAFLWMVRLKKDPASILPKLDEGKWQDKL